MEDEELNKREIDFEEEIEQLWKDGLIAKTYNEVVKLARKHGYTITSPILCTAYTIRTDAPHNDYRVDLYSSSNKIVITLIFKASKSKRLPFKLKTIRLFKQ